MFYDRFLELCRRRGVAPTRAAIEAGLSKATVSKWKANPETQISGKALAELSAYFGVTPNELLGETLPEGAGEPPVPPRIRRIARAGARMSEADQEKLLKLAQVLFPESFAYDDDTEA